jgi:hypothetical protein
MSKWLVGTVMEPRSGSRTSFARDFARLLSRDERAQGIRVHTDEAAGLVGAWFSVMADNHQAAESAAWKIWANVLTSGLGPCRAQIRVQPMVELPSAPSDGSESEA